MQAVIFEQPESLVVGEAPEPTCGDGEIVIRVARAGICGTDVHIYRNEYLSDFPLIPGHEFCGTVAAVGRDVKGFAEGDRVTADPNIDCGRCAFCRRHQNNHCEHWQGVGITRGGAFAEYVTVPARVAYRVPDELSDAQAAFIEPLACAVHAMNRLPLAMGEDVLVVGAGPMGLLLVQLLRHRGAARVVVTDLKPDRLALAEQFGAITRIADEQQGEGLRELVPHGFDVVADATGVPAAIECALDHLRPCGRFLQFGVAPRDATIALDPFRVFKHDWTIIGSFALCYTFEPAIALLAGGVVRVESLITELLPLRDFQRGFDAFAEGRTLRMHVRPGE